jgi:hypothetical protein
MDDEILASVTEFCLILPEGCGVSSAVHTNADPELTVTYRQRGATKAAAPGERVNTQHTVKQNLNRS